MAFGCDDGYYGNLYGCSTYGAYNFAYARCCNYAGTVWGAFFLWFFICLIFLAIMIAAARARQRRRMMYMEQMQMNQQPVIIT